MKNILIQTENKNQNNFNNSLEEILQKGATIEK